MYHLKITLKERRSDKVVHEIDTWRLLPDDVDNFNHLPNNPYYMNMEIISSGDECIDECFSSAKT